MLTDSAVQAIQDGVKTEVIDVGDRQFTTRIVFLPPEERTYRPDPLKLNTLTGIVDYVTGLDDPEAKAAIKGLLIHSPACVELIGALHGVKKERYTFVSADAVEGGKFPYAQYQDQEDFLIALGACFVGTPARQLVASIASHVIAEDSITLSDDGAAQTVSTKSGVSGVKRVTIQNPVKLAPYRTFAEVAQPECDFIFRQQKGSKGPQFALFPVQSSAWMLDAKASIKAFFAEHLPEMVVIG